MVSHSFQYGVILLSLSLGGCGLFSKDPDFYLEAKQEKPLKLPAKVSGEKIVDYYGLPKLKANADRYPLGQNLSIIPPASVIAIGDDVRGVYDSKASAVWMEQTREDIIEDLNSFFSSIEVKKSMEKKGNKTEIITGWYEQDYERRLDPKVSSEEDVSRVRYAYRLQLEPSDRNKEIKLSVRTRAREYWDEAGDKWSALSQAGSQREFELLNSFLSQRYELSLAKNKGNNFYNQSMRLTLTASEDKSPVFLSNAPYRRTWLKLSQVVENLGFEVDEKDLSDGLIVANFDYEDQFGVMDWLFGRKKNILELKTGTYRFQVKSLGRTAEIRVSDDESVALSSEELLKLQPAFSREFGKKSNSG